MAERNAESSNVNIWLPLAAGLMGAGLALLFAPRSGRETRAKLQSKAGDVKERAEESLASAQERLNESLEDAKALKARVGKAIHRNRDEASESNILNNWEEEL